MPKCKPPAGFDGRRRPAELGCEMIGHTRALPPEKRAVRIRLETKAGRGWTFLCAVLLAAVFAFPASAIPRRAARPQTAVKPTAAEILAASAEKGKALMAALRQYTYYTELTIQTVSQAD